MKKLNLAIGLSLGVLVISPGLADSPISSTDAANDVSYPVIDLQEVSVTDDTTSWISMNDGQPVDNNQPSQSIASTRASQSEYDKGYKAGLSKCDASYSPSDGSVHIPCIEVSAEGGTIMYKVDMKPVPDPKQFLFSVISAEPVQ